MKFEEFYTLRQELRWNVENDLSRFAMIYYGAVGSMFYSSIKEMED